MQQHSVGTGRARKRTVLCALAVVVGTLTVTGQAFADSATLSVTTTTGASDPAANVARVFTLSGTSAVPTNVWTKYRAPGGAACAPSASTDTGTQLYVGNGDFWGEAVNGAFSINGAGTWTTPGSFVFCFWLSQYSSDVSTPFTQTITFRAPTGTITATVNPISPMINQSFTVNVTGASEAPAEVYAKYRATGGAACAPTFSADSGQSFMNGRAVDGAFSLTESTTISTAGNYVLCLWLAQSSSDASPIAGPQPQPFTVVGPPPPKMKIPTSSTIRRRAARYSGRISTAPECKAGRTVVLRRTTSGVKSFGRALTRSDGTFTIKRARRMRGQVYVVVVSRAQGNTICGQGRTTTIRG